MAETGGRDRAGGATGARGQAVSFGERLRRLRQAAELTQEALAERAGVSARSISNLERGGPHTPRADTVALLAEALGLSPEDRAAFAAAARRAATKAPPSAVMESDAGPPAGALPAPPTSSPWPHACAPPAMAAPPRAS